MLFDGGVRLIGDSIEELSLPQKEQLNEDSAVNTLVIHNSRVTLARKAPDAPTQKNWGEIPSAVPPILGEHSAYANFSYAYTLPENEPSEFVFAPLETAVNLDHVYSPDVPERVRQPIELAVSVEHPYVPDVPERVRKPIELAVNFEHSYTPVVSEVVEQPIELAVNLNHTYEPSVPETVKQPIEIAVNLSHAYEPTITETVTQPIELGTNFIHTYQPNLEQS